MSNPDQKQNQDTINMIAKATPDIPANDAHREALRRRVLDAYDHRRADTTNANTDSDHAETQPARNPLFIFKGATAMKIAASLTFLAAVGIFAVTALTPSKAIAFEDVAREILKIENARFDITSSITYPDGTIEDQSTHKCVTKLPSLMRVEMPEGDIAVVDFTNDKMLIIDPKEKAAILMDEFLGFDESDNAQKNLFGEVQEHLRNAEKGGDFGAIKYEKLGEKKINETQAIGFRVLNPDADIEDFEGDGMSFNVLDIWADTKTGGPVQLEFTMELEDGSKVKSTFKNFAYNQELDPELFSFDAPEGFELLKANELGDLLRIGHIFNEEGELNKDGHKLADELAEELEKNIEVAFEDLDIQRPTHEDVIDALRAYARQTGGKLPATLESGPMIDAMVEAWEKANPGKTLFKEDSATVTFDDEQLEKDYQTILDAAMYLGTLEGSGGNYTYRGKGIRTGDEPRPVLWLQSKGATSYTVIYNDFSMQDTNQGPDTE